jgi:hypothetical protein
VLLRLAWLQQPPACQRQPLLTQQQQMANRQRLMQLMLT